MSSINSYFVNIPTEGGVTMIDPNLGVELIVISAATGVTSLNACYTISAPSETPEGTYFRFMVKGGLVTNTATGNKVNFFGQTLSDTQMLYDTSGEALKKDGSWIVTVSASDEGNKNRSGADLIDGSIPSGAIADGAVTLSKFENIAKGSIFVGNGVSNDIVSKDMSGSGKIGIGSGTDFSSVAMSGDVTISATGVTAIGAGKVTNAMLATPPSSSTIVKTINLTSSDILNMHSTSVEAIPAPGLGKVIVIEGAVAALDYGTTTYAGGSNFELVYDSATTKGIVSTDAGFITATSDTYARLDLKQQNFTTFNNAAVNIIADGSAYTTGDGLVQMIIKYRIESLSTI